MGAPLSSPARSAATGGSKSFAAAMAAHQAHHKEFQSEEIRTTTSTNPQHEQQFAPETNPLTESQTAHSQVLPNYELAQRRELFNARKQQDAIELSQIRQELHAHISQLSGGVREEFEIAVIRDEQTVPQEVTLSELNYLTTLRNAAELQANLANSWKTIHARKQNAKTNPWATTKQQHFQADYEVKNTDNAA